MTWPLDIHRQLAWLSGYYYLAATTQGFRGMSDDERWTFLRRSVDQSPTSKGLRQAQLEQLDGFSTDDRVVLLNELSRRFG